MLRRLAGSVVLTLASWAVRAQADDPALVERVQTLLAEGIEPGNAQASIAALGTDGERALEAVFERESAPRYVRLRALNVLATLGSETSTSYLRALANTLRSADARFGELHPARSSLVLRRVLEGLKGRALEPEVMMACLQHVDPQVRRVAADLLAAHPDADERVAARLNALSAHEPSRMVRASVERAMVARAKLHH